MKVGVGAVTTGNVAGRVRVGTNAGASACKTSLCIAVFNVSAHAVIGCDASADSSSTRGFGGGAVSVSLRASVKAFVREIFPVLYVEYLA